METVSESVGSVEVCVVSLDHKLTILRSLLCGSD